MKQIYLTSTYEQYQKIIQERKSKIKPLSEPLIELKLFKDSDLVLLDMAIEDHTRRCNVYDGIIAISLVDYLYPTKEEIEYFSSFINYYKDHAEVVLYGKKDVLHKFKDSGLFEYDIIEDKGEEYGNKTLR